MNQDLSHLACRTADRLFQSVGLSKCKDPGAVAIILSALEEAVKPLQDIRAQADALATVLEYAVDSTFIRGTAMHERLSAALAAYRKEKQP